MQQIQIRKKLTQLGSTSSETFGILPVLPGKLREHLLTVNSSKIAHQEQAKLWKAFLSVKAALLVANILFIFAWLANERPAA
jgi:hypothetical protein